MSMPEASAFLDGRDVEEGIIIPDGSTLEFLLVRGQKGVGKVWKNLKEICEVFGLDEDRLGEWRGKGLPIHEFLDGSILLTETDFDHWSAASLGLITHSASPRRMTDHMDLDAPYLSIKSAAKLTTLSQSQPSSRRPCRRPDRFQRRITRASHLEDQAGRSGGLDEAEIGREPESPARFPDERINQASFAPPLRTQAVGDLNSGLEHLAIGEVGITLGCPRVRVPRQLLEHRSGDSLARRRRRQECVAVVIEHQFLAILVCDDSRTVSQAVHPLDEGVLRPGFTFRIQEREGLLTVPLLEPSEEIFHARAHGNQLRFADLRGLAALCAGG